MNYKDIFSARKRIDKYIIKTPLIPLERLSQSLGFTPYVKLENLQNIGAFKIRGAMNAALKLGKEELSKGLITASSGNHGRAVAYAAKMLGTKALILLPSTVTSTKLKAIEELGARTMLVEPQKRIEIAQEISSKEGYHFIHPYNDEDVISGQGSLGLEILDQLPSTKRVLVPMGGGGLISGITLAIKEHNPQVEIIGLEPAAVPKFTINLSESKIISAPEKPSIADALLSNRPGSIALGVARSHIDRIISVEEEPLRKAYKFLVEEGRVYCEPSSAIGFGALIQGALSGLDMSSSVFVISGGNISLDLINKILY